MNIWEYFVRAGSVSPGAATTGLTLVMGSKSEAGVACPAQAASISTLSPQYNKYYLYVFKMGSSTLLYYQEQD